jgi:hypothetical protein
VGTLIPGTEIRLVFGLNAFGSQKGTSPEGDITTLS